MAFTFMNFLYEPSTSKTVTRHILDGFTAFFDPRVALSCLAFIFLYLAYSHILGRITRVKEGEDAAAPGCLLQILGTLFEGVVLGLFILMLLPSLWRPFGPPHPESFVLLAIRSGILASIALTLLSLLPWVGRFLARRPGLQVFLLGVVSYRLLAPLYFERSAFGAFGLKFHPPILSLGLLCIALCLLSSETLFWLHRLFAGAKVKTGSFSHKYLMPSLDILTGILPLLMYIQWGDYYVKL